VKTILVSAAVAMVLALFGTPFAIRMFTRRGYGQEIRDDGPSSHLTKRGTPTMGGAVIVVATLIGYVVGHVLTKDPMSTSGVLVLGLMTGLGGVGFVDDFMKIYKQTSLGLRSGAKLAGQAVVGAVFAVEVLRHPDGFDLTPADAHISFLRDVGPAIGVLPFVLWVVLMIAGWSNAVNLTDGLDGLASGGAILVLAGYVLIGIWQLKNDCSVALGALGEGSFFGEISTLSGRPRSATITTAAACEILELDRASLDAISVSHPRVRSVLEAFSAARAADPEAARARGERASD